MLYSNLDAKSANVYYRLESQLEAAAVKYVASKNHFSEGIITLNQLRSAGYIDLLTDNNGNLCSGYVVYKDLEYHMPIKLDVKNTTTFTSSEYGAVRYGLYINDKLVKKDYIHEDKILS